MVVGFNGFLGIFNNTYSELMTLFIGLKLSNNMGCNQICCYPDSKTIIDIVTKSVNKYHCYGSGIACVQELLRMNWEVQLCHSFREENVSADFLAKLRGNDAKFKIWDSPWEDLNSFLLSDSLKVLYP